MITACLNQDLHHFRIIKGVCEKINLIGEIDVQENMQINHKPKPF